MSARATRGPTAGPAIGLPCVVVEAAGLGTGFRDGFFWDGCRPSCRTNHSRRVSSETTTPIFASDSAMMRTDVPVFRSFRRTTRNRSSSAALMVFLALASPISALNLWASSWHGFVFIRETVGGSCGIEGKSLGKNSAIVGRNQGKHQRLAGENLSVKRLDVGVSKQSSQPC